MHTAGAQTKWGRDGELAVFRGVSPTVDVVSGGGVPEQCGGKPADRAQGSQLGVGPEHANPTRAALTPASIPSRTVPMKVIQEETSNAVLKKDPCL